MKAEAPRARSRHLGNFMDSEALGMLAGAPCDPGYMNDVEVVHIHDISRVLRDSMDLDQEPEIPRF